MRWETVSPEAAKTHPLYGANGWLVLPMIGMFFTPIVIAITSYRIFGALDYSKLPQIYINFLIVEISLNVVLAIWAWTNLWLLSTKRAAAVRSMISLYAVFPVFVLLDSVSTKFMLDYLGAAMSWEEIFDKDTGRTLIRTVIGAAIWIPYMLQSKRVNVTFLHRVRPDDPLAAPSNF